MQNEETTIAKIGEFKLIERIKKIVPSAKHSDVLIGIGDDASSIRLDEHRILLLTCDIQIEDRHFRRNTITPYQLGRRAVAVNLSDIAAMGGKPTFALVSLGLPDSFLASDYDQLFAGMQDQLSEFSAAIIGGNLAKSEDKLIIDITMLGEVSPHNLVTRSGAQPGDRIFVTGVLGASAAGYEILSKYCQKYPQKFQHLVSAHLQPVPKVQVGAKIAACGFCTAMIDISDGIASDLYHICEQSHVGAVIYQNQIPLPASIEEVNEFSNKHPLYLALHGGEDYELLVTCKPEVTPAAIQLIADECNVKITEIGRIVSAEDGFTLINENDKHTPIQPKGWDHFGLDK